MIFGRRRYGLSIPTLTSTWGLFAALCALLVFAAAGCGGGGDDGETDPNAPPVDTTPRFAYIVGRVINNNTNENVAGATIRFGTLTTTTDDAGRFSLQVPADTTAGFLRVESPADAQGRALYYSEGYHRGLLIDLRNTGIQVPLTGSADAVLSADETANIGDIKLGSTNDPPFPPPI